MKSKMLVLMFIFTCITVDATNFPASEVSEDRILFEEGSSKVLDEESNVEATQTDVEQKLQKLGINQTKEKSTILEQEAYEGKTVFESESVLVDKNVLNIFTYATYTKGDWYTPFFSRNVSGEGIVLDDRVSYNSKETKIVDNVEYYVYHFTGNELDASITIHIVESQLVFEIVYFNKTSDEQQIKTFADFDTCMSKTSVLNFGSCLEDYVPIYSQGDAKGVYLNSEKYDVNFMIDYLGQNKPDYSRAYAWRTNPNLVANQISAAKGEMLLDNKDTAVTFGWDDTIGANEEIKYVFSFGIVEGDFFAIEDEIEADLIKSIKEEQYLSDDELIELFNVSATIDRISGITNGLLVDQSAVNYGVPGEYQVIFSILTPSGKSLEQAVSLIIEDVLPTLTVDQSRVSIKVNQQLLDILKQIKVEASELVNGDLTEMISVDDQAVDYSTPGEYQVKFTVSDQEGNNAMYNLMVIVKELDKIEVESGIESEIEQETESEIEQETESEIKSIALEQMSIMDTGHSLASIVIMTLSLFGFIIAKQVFKFLV